MSLFDASNFVISFERTPEPHPLDVHTGSITAAVGRNPKPNVLVMIKRFLEQNPAGIVILNDTCGRFNVSELMDGVDAHIHDRIELYQHDDQTPMSLTSFVDTVVKGAMTECVKTLIVSSTIMEQDRDFHAWAHAYKTTAKLIRGSQVAFLSCGEQARTM